MVVSERYRALAVGANSTTVNNTSNSVGGFICVTSGSIGLVSNAPGTPVLLATMPVVAGTYYPLPIYASVLGFTFTTSGGASGTLLY